MHDHFLAVFPGGSSVVALAIPAIAAASTATAIVVITAVSIVAVTAASTVAAPTTATNPALRTMSSLLICVVYAAPCSLSVTINTSSWLVVVAAAMILAGCAVVAGVAVLAMVVALISLFRALFANSERLSACMRYMFYSQS